MGDGLPVSEVRLEVQAGKPNVLQINLLLLCEFLASESGETIQKKGEAPVNGRRGNEEDVPGTSSVDLEHLQLPTTTGE